jgi:RimJ/RimL family protein N-acetyltransferase
MSFGDPMGFSASSKDGENTRIIMRPFRSDENIILADGFSHYEVAKYLGSTNAFTPDQETEWIKETAEEKDSVVWAICVAKNSKERVGRPIGTSSIGYIRNNRGVSGCAIYDTDMWGKGIASACHKARCYYAHYVLGLKAIDSGVAYPNHGSLKALLSAGYVVTGKDYSTFFAAGNWHNTYRLTWVNPTQYSWAEFWGHNKPEAEFVSARKNAKESLKWAKHNVTFL